MPEKLYLVPVMAGDGLVLVPHTREELERLWKDVDPVAWAMDGFNEEDTWNRD